MSHHEGGAGAPELRAEVATFALPDVFGWLEATAKSGVVHFTHRDHQKEVYLHRGEVVFAASNQMVDRLGECLLRAGVIGLEQLRDAERCFQPGTRFGKILVERGFLTPRELWNGVKYQVEEIVRSLFAYSTGSVEFHEGEFQPDNVVRLALGTRRLVAEGVQRAEELRKFLAVLEGPRVELAVVKESEIPLAATEQEIADAIGRQSDFSKLCDELEMDRESAARSVQLLRLVGAVKLVRRQGDEGFVSEGDLQADAAEQIRAVVGGFGKLLEALAEPIASAEGGPEGIRERVERTLEEAAGRYPELLAGVSLLGGVALDLETVVERTLRLGDERLERVSLALGELVSYLEFELKNHPDVEDADGLIRGMGPLRAELGV